MKQINMIDVAIIFVISVMFIFVLTTAYLIGVEDGENNIKIEAITKHYAIDRDGHFIWRK